jgi:hypothetical protein
MKEEERGFYTQFQVVVVTPLIRSIGLLSFLLNEIRWC